MNPQPAVPLRPAGGAPQRAVLVFNAGSSSVKFAAFGLDGGQPAAALLAGQIDGIGLRPRLRARGADGAPLADEDLGIEGPVERQHAQALAQLMHWLAAHGEGLEVVAAGHRVVHGGVRYTEPVVVDDGVLAALAALVPLAPLHQPHNLAPIRALARERPQLPQVACFDTAFHATAPRLAQLFGLPRALTDEGVRRYGFHGLSYEYIAGQLPRVAGEHARERVLVAHLGNGASMCALRDGRSVGSSMGFTAVDGLMMGTRTGTLDAGVVLYLLEHKGWDASRITTLLYKESGLLGVSGESSDMRTLLASSRPQAREAVELFCHRAVREAGALVAAMGGIDVLVFTGGIGAHAPAVRARIAQGLAWLGIELGPAELAAAAGHEPPVPVDAGHPAAILSAQHSRVLTLAMHTDEERMIARHTARLALRARGAVVPPAALAA